MTNNNVNPPTQPYDAAEFSRRFLTPAYGMGVSGIDFAARRGGDSPYRQELNKYDSGLTPALYESGYERNPMLAQQYLRSANQTWGQQLRNGFGSRSLSILAKTGQGIGHVIGAAGAAVESIAKGEGDLSLAYDNAIVKAFQGMDEELKEAMPVYQSKAYMEGNWVQKLGTTSFWATDGFDGIAFLASAYVPGLALGKVGSLSKVLAASRMKGIAKFGEKLASFKDATGASTKLMGSTFYNTVSEAGFEAAESNNVLREEYARQMGYASFEDSKKNPEDNAIIRDKAGAGAARTYWWNVGALLAPNAFQSKWMHGNKTSLARELKRKYRADPKLAQQAAISKWDYAKGFGKGVLSEGLWEENIQTSVAQYEERLAKGGTDQNALTGPLNNLMRNAWSFAKTIGTLGMAAPQAGSEEDQAGSAIFLGALLGGGMSLYSTYAEHKAEKEKLKEEGKQWDLWKKVNAPAKTLLAKNFKSPFEVQEVVTDQEGNQTLKYTNSENPQPVLNPEAGKALGFRHATTKTFMGEAMLGYEKNDDNHIGFNVDMNLAAYAYSIAAQTPTKEDAFDLIDLDNNFKAEDGMAEFGADNLIEQNKEKLKALVEQFYEVENEISGREAQSDNKLDQVFDDVMKRNAFYLKAKRRAVENLKNIDPTEKQEMLDAIDNQYEDFKKNRKFYKERFTKQAEPAVLFTDKLAELIEEFNSGKITQTELNKQLALIDYLAKEAEKIYGTENTPYEGPIGLSNWITANSESLENSQAIEKGPLGYIAQMLYKVGKTNMVESDVATAAATINDPNGVENFIEKLQTASMISPAIAESVQEVTGGLQARQQSYESAVSKMKQYDPRAIPVDQVSPGEDASLHMFVFDFEGNLNGPIEDLANILGIDTSNARAQTIDFVTALQQAYADRLSELTQQLDQLNNDLGRINSLVADIESRQDSAQQNDLLLQAGEDYKAGKIKAAHEKLVSYHINRIFEGVDLLLANYYKSPKEFLKLDEVDSMIRSLQTARNAFKLRKDIDPKMAKNIIDRIDEYLEQLREAREQVIENRNNRFAKQQATIEQNKLEFSTVFKFDSNGHPSTTSRVYPVLQAAFGNTAKINEVFDAAKLDDGSLSPKAVYTILQYAVSKADSKVNLDAALNLDLEIKAARDKFIANTRTDWLTDIKKVIKNVYKYGPYLLNTGMKLDALFADASTPFYRFTKHKDLATLKFELEQTIDENTGAYRGLTPEQSKKLDENIDLLGQISGLKKAVEIVTSNYDVVEALKQEEAISKELASNEDNPIAPTAQQFSAVQQLLSYIFSNSKFGPMGDVSVLQGVLGSGKSLVGMRYVIKIAKKLLGLKDSNIAAFGHNEYSSQNIAKSVFDDQSNAGTMEDFLARTDMSGLKLVVIDEAMAMSNEDIKQVYAKITAENEKRGSRKDHIKIIALGDNSQITVERVDQTELGSLGNSATKDTAGLSVVYRTNVNTIVDVVNDFKDKPQPVTEVTATTSHTKEDLKAQPTTNDAFGVLGGTREDLIQLVNKPSEKSRVIIVNNETEAETMRAALPAGSNVDVRVYFDAQSWQWDQVYIYMDKSKGKWDRSDFRDELEYNAAMYTMVGRAKQFVFIANPSVKVNTPVVDSDIASKVEDNTEEFNKNNELYTQHLEATKAALKAIDSSLQVEVEEKPTEEEKEEESKVKKETGTESAVEEEVLGDSVSEEERDVEDIEEEDEPDNEDETHTLPPTKKPITKLPPPISPDKDTASPFRHAMHFPSKSLIWPENMADTTNGDIDPSQPGTFIVDDTNTVHLVQERNGRIYHIAQLSEQELQEDGWANMVAHIDAVPKVRSSAIDKTSIGFTLHAGQNLESFTLATMEFEQVHGLRYQLNNVLSNVANTLDSVFNKWFRGFYQNAGGGRGIEPHLPFYKADGSIDYSRAYIHVFSGKEIQQMESDPDMAGGFKPKKGIPYLVIKNPGSMNYSDPEADTDERGVAQYIRLEPRRLTEDNHLIKTLRGYQALATTLKNQYNVDIGSPAFNTLMNAWRSRLKGTSTSSKPEINPDVSGTEILEQLDKESYDLMGPEAVANLVSLLDQMATEYIFGVKNGPKMYTRAEAEELIKEEDSPYHKEFEATKTLKDKEKMNEARVWVLYYKDSDGEKADVVTGPNITSTQGPAQRALNVLAKTNKRMNDVTIRVDSNKARYSYTKSLLASQGANNQYFAWKQRALFNLVDFMITRYPEDMKDFRRADLTAPDDQGRVSTSKMEQHIVAFMHKHVLNQNPTIQGEANAKFTEEFNKYLDAKEQVKKELSTKPLTLENLNQALSNLSTLRTPLNRNLINKLGKQLHKPEVREELNSLLTDFFAGVLPTTVSGVVVPAGQTAPTKRAPEQEKPRQAPETEPETPPTKESTVDTAPIEQTVETALKEKAYGVKDSTTKIKAHLERIANGGFKNGTNSVSDEHAKFMSILASYILKKLNSKGGLGVGIYEATAESILVQEFKDVYGFVTHKDFFWQEFQKKFEDENDYQLVFMPGQIETNYDQNFMHELLHALTVPGLTEGASPQASQKAKEFHDQLVALQVQLYEQLEAEGLNPRDLFEDTPSDLTEREFIANLSNPRFLAKVKETKIDFSGFFKDLFTAILKWLGVPTETQEDLTILDGMIGAMENYLGDRIWTEEPIILTPTPPVQQPTQVKEGVPELFESNPELADAIYEALGFNTPPRFFEGNTLSIGDKAYTISEKISSKNLAKRYGFKISSNIPVYIVKENLGIRKGGYDINQNIIILSENSDKETIEHELIHSVEYNLDKKELVPLYEKVKNKITENSFKDYVSWNFKKSISEFVADGISKKVFRDALKKEGLLDEVDSALAIYKTEISPQQKQQALQQYSAYIDTIFPDSKVKDIIYHGAIESLLPKDGNFKGYVTYFTDSKNYAETFGIPVNRKLLQAVVNIQNPYNAKSELADVPKEVHDGGEYTNPRIVKENNKNYDSVIGVDAGQQEGATFAVFEPEQIHVLGTQKDIQGFKQFVQNTQSVDPVDTTDIDEAIIDAQEKVSELPEQEVKEPIAQPNPKAVKEQIQQLELELANLERELEEAKQVQEVEDTIPEIFILKYLKGAITKESAEREHGGKVGKDIDRYYIATKGKGNTIATIAGDLANIDLVGSVMDEGELVGVIADMIDRSFTENYEQYIPAQAPIKRDIQQLKAEIKDLKEMGMISTEGKVVPMKSTAEDSASQEPAPFDPNNMDEVVAWVKVVFNENQYNQQGYNRVNKKYSQEALNAIAEAFNILIDQQDSVEAKAPEQEFDKASNEQFIAWVKEKYEQGEEYGQFYEIIEKFKNANFPPEVRQSIQEQLEELQRLVDEEDLDADDVLYQYELIYERYNQDPNFSKIADDGSTKNTIYDFVNDTSFGGDKQARVKFAQDFLGITPQIAAKGVRPDKKRWVDIVHQALKSHILTPELGIITKMLQLSSHLARAKRLSDVEGLGEFGSRQNLVRSLIQLVWNHGLERTSNDMLLPTRSSIKQIIQSNFPNFEQATTKDYIDFLTDAYFADKTDPVYKKVKPFIDNLNSLINGLSFRENLEDGSPGHSVAGFVAEKIAESKALQPQDTSPISTDTTNVSFVVNNFENPMSYMYAKSWMLDEMSKLLESAKKPNGGLVKSRQELLLELLLNLNKEIGDLNRQRNLSGDDLLKRQSLSTMRKTWGNKPLLFHMLKTIYPNWDVSTISDVEDVVEGAEEFADANEKRVGIRKETEDADQIDQESRLTDSVKEMLSFIKNPTYAFLKRWHPKKFLSNKHTFVAMMSFINDYVDLNLLDPKDWAAQQKSLDRRRKTTFSGIENTIYQTLAELVSDMNYVPENEDIAKKFNLEVEKDSLDVTTISIVFDPTGNLLDKDGRVESVEQSIARRTRQVENNKATNERVRVYTRNMLPMEAFAEMQKMAESVGLTLDVATFNGMYKASAAANTIRELTNTFQSLTEKSYKIAEHDNDFGDIITKYFEASGFGLTKSIEGNLRHVLEVLHDTTEGGLAKIVKSKFATAYQMAKNQDKNAVAQFLKDFGMADAADTIDTKQVNRNANIYAKIVAFIDEAAKITPEKEVSELFEKETTIIKSLRSVLKYSEDQLRQKSVTDSKNNKIYTSTPKSWLNSIFDRFTKARANNKFFKGASGINRVFGVNIPVYLKSAYFQASPFLNGIQKIFKSAEHDATKNVLTKQITSFTREDEKLFYTRAFTHGFLDTVGTGSTADRSYDQFTYQVADKPRISSAQIRVLDYSELKESAKGYIRQALMKDDKFIKAYQKRHTEGRNLNFSVMDEAINRYLEDNNLEVFNKDGSMGIEQVQDTLSTYIVDILKEKGAKFVTDTLLPSQALISSKAFRAAKRLMKSDGNFAFLEESLANLERLPKNSTHKWTESQRQQAVRALTPIAQLFYANNYLNGYGLNQMLTGPFNYYKHTEDIVKRMSGVVGPGIYMWINKLRGAKKTYRTLVVNDREQKKESLQQLIDNLVTDPHEREQLKAFFEAFESTDGQGFMTPQRHAELKRGYGKAYGLGNVMKPMYFDVITKDRVYKSFETYEEYEAAKPELNKLFGKDNYSINEDILGGVDIIVQEPMPIYVKYSSVVLSDQLVNKYPGLKRIRDYMEDANADELVFKSAIKAASPTTTIDLEDVYTHVKGWPLANKEKVETSTLTLNNANYKMQFNPKAKVDSKVSIFTQLMYFLNIMGTNPEQAKAAYNAVAYLMDNALADLNDELSSPAKIHAKLTKLMDSPGNEAIKSLLDAGVDLSNPAVSKKTFTQLASLVENSVQKVKFKGTKLVLQSEEGITKNYDPNTNFEVNYRNNKLKFVKLDNGSYAAEVIVPKGMLTAEQLSNLERGEDTYILPDFFGYRIPSTEIHSAVPMKVVGVYDNADTNVVIAPSELVYLHGSDFDVDSLFVIQREVHSPSESKILGLEQYTPIGYIRDAATDKWKFDYKNDRLREHFDKINSRIRILEKLQVSVDEDNKVTVSVSNIRAIKAEIRSLKNLKRKLKDSYTKNMIMDIMLSTITDQKNRARMNTPIVMSLFKDDNNPNSVKSILSEKGLWAEDDNRDLSYLENSYTSLKSMKDGAILTGAFANAIKDFAYMYTAGEGGNRAVVDPDSALRLNGKVYNQIQDTSEPSPNQKGANLTWQYLDAAVNLAIDNLNEMILPKLGINTFTGNAWASMVALGMNIIDTLLVIKNPLVQKIGTTGYSRPNIAIPQLQAETLTEVLQEFLSTEDFTKLEEKLSTKGNIGKITELKKVLDTIFVSENDLLGEVGLTSEHLELIAKGDDKALEDLVAQQNPVAKRPQYQSVEATNKVVVGILKFKALELFQQAYKLGEASMALSDMLNVIRINPGTPEKMDKFDESFNKIFDDSEFEELPKDATEEERAEHQKKMEGMIQTVGSETYAAEDETPSEYEKKVSKLAMKLRVKDSFPFKIPELLKQAPHIARAIAATKFTQEKIAEILPKFREPVKEYAQEVSADLDFLGFGLNRVTYVDILDELEHFLIASLFSEQMKSEPLLKSSKASFTNVTAFNKRLVMKLDKLKKADEIAYNNRKNAGYVRNRFLNSLHIDSKKYIVRIRMANYITPSIGDIALLKDDFNKLRDFAETVNEKGIVTGYSYDPDPSRPYTSAQRDLLTFAVINSGFKFSSTSYAGYVEPDLYKDVDKAFTTLFDKFSKDSDMRAQSKEIFQRALAFRKANMLRALPKSKILDDNGKVKRQVAVETIGLEKAGTTGKYRGKGTVPGFSEEVFFDRKFTVAEEDVDQEALAEERKQQEIINDELGNLKPESTEEQEDQSLKTSALAKKYPKYALHTNRQRDEDSNPTGLVFYEVFERLNPTETLAESEHIYYQKIGRKTSSSYFVDIDSEFNQQAFHPKYRTLNLADNSINYIKELREDIQEGETVRLVNYDDASRVSVRYVRVSSKKEIKFGAETLFDYGFETVSIEDSNPGLNASSSQSTAPSMSIYDFLREVTNTTNDNNCI